MKTKEVEVAGAWFEYVEGDHPFQCAEDWVVKRIPWQPLRDSEGVIQLIAAYVSKQDTLYYFKPRER